MERVREYLASKKISQHQLDSFDDLLSRKVPAAVAAGNENFVNIKTDENPPASFRCSVSDLRYLRPTYHPPGAEKPVQLLPNVCRALGMSYSLVLTATVTVAVDDGASSTDVAFPDVVVGHLPLMLHSELCYLSGMSRDELMEAGEDPDDPGGYFIVWGAEKVIVTQERGAPNTPIVSKKVDAGRHEWTLTVRSCPMDNPVGGVITQLVAKHDGQLGHRVYVRVPGRFVTDVDVAVVFRAMGVESDRAIVRSVADPADGAGARERALAELLRGSLVAAHGLGVKTQGDAVRHLGPLTPYGSDRISTRSDREGSRGRTHALYILRREFLAGAGDGFPGKAKYLGRLVRKLLLALAGLEEPTDRESLRQKRFLPSGMLLDEVFQQAYKSFVREATNAIDRAWYKGMWRNTGDVTMVVNRQNASTVFNHAPVTSVMQSSMRGNWGKRDRDEDGGIVQDLARGSWLQFLSHLRRTNNPIDRDLKITSPHDLHPTQWGYLCPIDSPDGANVGLTNNLAILCSVTADSSPVPVIDFVAEDGGEPFSTSTADRDADDSCVHVNGIPAFYHRDPKGLVGRLRSARRNGALMDSLSVGWDIPRREVHLWTDGGRCTRPLFVAGSRDRTEYIDVDEAENTLVAWSRDQETKAHTHSEIHPTAGLSVYAVTIPLMQHNQGARNVLGAQQGKQSAGVYTTAWRTRIDKTGMILNYPQRALVRTAYEESLAVSEHPGGVNTVVAIMCYSGYNQEDGLIVNRTSLERGMFGLTYVKNAMEEEEASPDRGLLVRFGNPDALESLDAKGMPFENRPVRPGDALIGKVRRDESGEGFLAMPSRPADENWAGYVVDKVFVYDKPEGKVRVAKVRYRKVRSPKPGDKLASRHGQKGVIGIALPESMMPFTKDGIVPDVIVNPHAFPSRMTLGQLFECLGAKAASVTGEPLDATVFAPVDARALGDSLEAAGFAANCEEVMYAGTTGEQIAGNVFVGPTYYQRLKQMTEDKINYRGGRGAKDVVTGQPIGGRARGGGLRIGEMENNSILGHGVMGFAAESMGERSDRMGVWSDGAGVPAVHNEALDSFRQSSAGDEDRRFVKHVIPRGFVAFRHELNAMGIDTRLLVERQEQEVADDLRRTCGME
jgi:DNA-directed RNA polymerase beta subunit